MYSPSSRIAPSAKTARAMRRRHLRGVSPDASVRLAKCIQAPRAVRPQARAENGTKRNRNAWSWSPSKAPVSRARAKPTPAPAGKIQRRRSLGTAVFLVGDGMAVAFFEPAAEKAGTVDQVQPLALDWSRRIGIFDRLGHRSLLQPQVGFIGIEAPQDVVFLAGHPDDGVRRLGVLDLALRPEAERGVRLLPEDELGLSLLRAAHPEIHLEVVVIGEGEDLADHLLHLVQEPVGRGGGDRLRLRRRRGLRGSRLRFRRGGFLGLRLGGHRQHAPPEAGERDARMRRGGAGQRSGRAWGRDLPLDLLELIVRPGAQGRGPRRLDAVDRLIEILV